MKMVMRLTGMLVVSMMTRMIKGEASLCVGKADKLMSLIKQIKFDIGFLLPGISFFTFLGQPDKMNV